MIVRHRRLFEHQFYFFRRPEANEADQAILKSGRPADSSETDYI